MNILEFVNRIAQTEETYNITLSIAKEKKEKDQQELISELMKTYGKDNTTDNTTEPKTLSGSIKSRKKSV